MSSVNSGSGSSGACWFLFARLESESRGRFVGPLYPERLVIEGLRQPQSGGCIKFPCVALFSPEGAFFRQFTGVPLVDDLESRDDSRAPDLLKSEQMNRVFWGIALKMTYRFTEIPPSASDAATVFVSMEGDVANLA